MSDVFYRSATLALAVRLIMTEARAIWVCGQNPEVYSEIRTYELCYIRENMRAWSDL